MLQFSAYSLAFWTKQLTPIIVTNCSRRKRGTGTGKLSIGRCPPGNLEQVASWWMAECAADAGPRLPAGVLYQGRAFAVAKKAAEHTGGPLFIVSAGMGLVSFDLPTPDYDLTTAPGPNSLMTRVSAMSWNPGEWWRLINGSRKRLADLPSRTNGKVLIALSAPYMEMIQADLLSARPNALSRCRLFTSTLGARTLPDPLKRLAMPYDARLDGIGRPYAGTLSDLPQRALLHFVESGWAIAPTAPEEDVVHVDEALRGFEPRPIVRRLRLGDEELLSLLCENRIKLRSAGKAPLRFVRDDLGIACEQGRFSRLYKRFKDYPQSQESS